jgi:hypothetical protein
MHPRRTALLNTQFVKDSSVFCGDGQLVMAVYTPVEFPSRRWEAKYVRWVRALHERSNVSEPYGRAVEHGSVGTLGKQMA